MAIAISFFFFPFKYIDFYKDEYFQQATEPAPPPGRSCASCTSDALLSDMRRS